MAALAARLTGRPAKCCYDRDDDMIITGKRHDFRIDYRVGFDDEGRILGIEVRPGGALRHVAPTCRSPCADRAMLHADNAYYLPAVRITSYRCKTHTQSNTAFRGFGGPQGMVGMERVIDEIAHALGRDPLAVRRVNFYDHKEMPAGATVSTRRPDTRTAQPDALPSDGRGLRDPGDRRRAGGLVRLPAPARRDPRLERGEPAPEARHRPDAGEVRHLLHQHAR